MSIREYLCDLGPCNFPCLISCYSLRQNYPTNSPHSPFSSGELPVIPHFLPSPRLKTFHIIDFLLLFPLPGMHSHLNFLPGAFVSSSLKFQVRPYSNGVTLLALIPSHLETGKLSLIFLIALQYCVYWSTLVNLTKFWKAAS